MERTRKLEVYVIPAAFILALFVISLFWAFNRGETANTVSMASTTKPVDSETTADSTKSEQSTAADTVAATQDGLTAQLVFTQPCWIVVKVDGKPSLKAEYAVGTSKEVKGADKIELVSIGNAGGLSVTLNGKALPSLGKTGEVLSNVVLTKDNLN